MSTLCERPNYHKEPHTMHNTKTQTPHCNSILPWLAPRLCHRNIPKTLCPLHYREMTRLGTKWVLGKVLFEKLISFLIRQKACFPPDTNSPNYPCLISASHFLDSSSTTQCYSVCVGIRRHVRYECFQFGESWRCFIPNLTITLKTTWQLPESWNGKGQMMETFLVKKIPIN